jgi:beta-phosphoglucomutase-like phosphatase (HAD superfamily)
MILAAAEALGVPAHQVVVIGDIGANVRAAEAAGARSVMAPNGRHPLRRGDRRASGCTRPGGRRGVRHKKPVAMETVLVTRTDNDGDVLLAGPAVRAVAATAGRVVLPCRTIR